MIRRQRVSLAEQDDDVIFAQVIDGRCLKEAGMEDGRTTHEEAMPCGAAGILFERVKIFVVRVCDEDTAVARPMCCSARVEKEEAESRHRGRAQK